jgi:hypothetical protein
MTDLRVSVATWTIDLNSEVGQIMSRTVEEEGLTVNRQQLGFAR